MQRASDLFDEAQRSRVEKAVADAEANTSCELVPVVATSSGRYDRAEDIIGLWLATAAAVTVWMTFPRQSVEAGQWDGIPGYAGLFAMVACVPAAFMIGATAGSRIAWLRRLFTPRSQMLDEVSARAREVFFDKRVHHTSGATGMLLYVSLYEHMAVVLGDQQVVDSLEQQSLNQLCELLTERLHEGDAADALCSVLAEAGKQLSQPLPRTETDVNELQDALILID